LRASYSTFGCHERSKSFHQIKTRSKKSSSLVHVTLQSPHKIKTRSKEEFQPCACDLAVTPQKKNQDQESPSH
jgi:hypothetical protein